MTKVLAALVFIAGAAACVRHSPEQRREVVVHASMPIVTAVSCPGQNPAASRFRVFSGSADATLDAQTGTLIFDVQIDSTPERGAQIHLRSQTLSRDMPYSDSVTRVTIPTGRYYFRARRIGARTLEDSINVRNGFVDTVRVLLGRDKLCPA
jgi:hypothetical protein